MYRHPSQRFGLVGQCFANRDGDGCAIMLNRKCEGKCPFHKTRKLLKAEQDAVLLRLSGLPAGQRQHIVDKYFKGMPPWDDGARIAWSGCECGKVRI